MTMMNESWTSDVEAFGARYPALSQAVFAAVADTLTDAEQREYERVLDAALASAAGDRDLATELLRHLLLEEPSVAAIHLRLERTWLLILDNIRAILAANYHRCRPA